jgi:hypothetical protein
MLAYSSTPKSSIMLNIYKINGKCLNKLNNTFKGSVVIDVQSKLMRGYSPQALP